MLASFPILSQKRHLLLLNGIDPTVWKRTSRPTVNPTLIGMVARLSVEKGIDHTDIQLPGPIPFTWERVWYSTSTHQGPLGSGWHHKYDMALTYQRQDDLLILRTEDGRHTPFTPLNEGESYFNRREQLRLDRKGDSYVLTDSHQLSYLFKKVDQLHSDS